MVGLQILKHIYALSDDEVVSNYKENPYQQYFCGGNKFENKSHIVATSLTKFRNRIGKSGFEKIFAETIKIGIKEKVINKSSCESVIIDTTVTENNVTYPTDAKLLEKTRIKLVNLAKKAGVKLRQTYNISSPRLSIKSARYFHAKQMKMGKQAVKKCVITYEQL